MNIAPTIHVRLESLLIGLRERFSIAGDLFQFWMTKGGFKISGTAGRAMAGVTSILRPP
jgi:hypothetical protein